MNFQNACEILKLNKTFSLKELKHNYHFEALKYHPDKNNAVDAKENFIQVQEAYEYLKKYLKVVGPDMETESNHDSLIRSFIKHLFKNSVYEVHIDFIDNLIFSFSQQSNDISLVLFEELNKEAAISIYGYLVQYKDILGIRQDILCKYESILREKIKNDNIILLNPTLKNLLNEELFKLEYNNDTYWIPLWHNEISYDITSKDNQISNLIVKCIPTLPHHISIDQYNNIHINIKTHIKKVFEIGYIKIKLEEKEYQINACDLFIKKSQTYQMLNKGIAMIHPTNIYDVSQKSSLYIHVELE
jgi:hypothetical protein